jgi:hypothetical protein
VCPHCHKNAPIVYRGVMAYCTACGGPRPPFSGKSLQLAGQPSMIGGTVARVFGWVVLGVGLFVALTVAWILGLIFSGTAALAFGVPIGLLTLIVSLPMLFGGKKLAQSGEKTQAEARFEAIYALAANRGGAVTAIDCARSLGIGEIEAERTLTAMTKQFPDYVTLEVDDEGKLFYKLTGVGQEKPFGVKYRVEVDGRVRIEDQLDAGRKEQAEWEARLAEQEAAKRRG